MNNTTEVFTIAGMRLIKNDKLPKNSLMVAANGRGVVVIDEAGKEAIEDPGNSKSAS